MLEPRPACDVSDARRLKDADTHEDWERVLAAAARLQSIVPEAVLVGGCAAALYAGHRFSRDDDHVVADLRARFDAVLQRLEEVAGWKTARISRPVQILGQLDGVDTGIRQLRRTRPLETVSSQTRFGTITIPSAAEMLRVKAYLVVTRNAARDYIDVAALSDLLDRSRDGAGAEILAAFDDYYPQDNGASIALQVAKQLAEPMPYDVTGDGDLSVYRITDPRWATWSAVRSHTKALAARVVRDYVRRGDDSP